MRAPAGKLVAAKRRASWSMSATTMGTRSSVPATATTRLGRVMTGASLGLLTVSTKLLAWASTWFTSPSPLSCATTVMV